MDILILISVGLVGIWFGYTLATQKTKEVSNAPVSEATEEKENNKNRVLVILGNKGQITNDDVEEALSVSDATASRYLTELEEEGKIRQVGNAGRGVYYVPADNSRTE